MTPSRSYLLQALHQWITDNDMTPHIAVDTRMQGVLVPVQFIQNDQIVLNIGYGAVRDLLLGHDAISFNARFGGVPMNVFVPVAAIVAIYARENGMGMVFGMEPGADLLTSVAQTEVPSESPEPPGPPKSKGPSGVVPAKGTKAGKGGKSKPPSLKIVK
ncbi:ClpXP protease specificity-enhancing factor [Nitrincola alkalilacustris]|uniref:ClpXP protease specificity-enhancing factor n=1 Tax=Nitrincola alkalilacustris TaxID=1571224 RepID=UPI00124F29AD|nr:ClpXP protease specificity-enhancing factor [Nitrincola alkalilacustris]